jgi:hypothetical protein
MDQNAESSLYSISASVKIRVLSSNVEFGIYELSRSLKVELSKYEFSHWLLVNHGFDLVHDQLNAIQDTVTYLLFL